MPYREHLEIDAWISVHQDHPVSCDVYIHEVRFKLGPNDNSLMLCFTWPALTKFLRVANEVAKLSNKRPLPGREPYEVDADELSCLAHRSSRARPGETRGMPARSTSHEPD